MHTFNYEGKVYDKIFDMKDGRFILENTKNKTSAIVSLDEMEKVTLSMELTKENITSGASFLTHIAVNPVLRGLK